MRISDTELERIVVSEHIAALMESAASTPPSLSLRCRFGRWLVLTGLRLAPELRPVT